MKTKNILNSIIEIKNYKLLGKGAFGEVYKGIHIKTNKKLAIKIEHKDKEYLLKKEAYILLAIRGIKYFPKLYSYKNTDKGNYLIMNYLGKNLNYYIKYKKKFSIDDSMRIFYYYINILEKLHDHSIIHRDIKPDNMTYDYNKNEFNLIDFSISKYYKDKNYNHIQFVQNKKLIGTVRFASVNSHKGYELSRRDDIESLIYCILYFIKGILPWQNSKGKNKEEKYNNIRFTKEEISLNILFKEIPVELFKIYIYIKNLEFEDEPNYDFIRNTLNKYFILNNINIKKKFNFENFNTNEFEIDNNNISPSYNIAIYNNKISLKNLKNPFNKKNITPIKNYNIFKKNIKLKIKNSNSIDISNSIKEESLEEKYNKLRILPLKFIKN